MKYLIDTHVLLWVADDNRYLSKKSNEILKDKSCKIFVSTISFWEIAIKHSSGKLEIGFTLNELWQFAGENKIEILPVMFSDYEIVDKLPFPKNNGTDHRDPFDRMLIAQSLTNDLSIRSLH